MTLPCLSAQSNEPDAKTRTSTDPSSAASHWTGKNGNHGIDVITAAEKQELAKARKEALDQNPALQENITAAEQAMKAARDEMKAAQGATLGASRSRSESIAG